MDTLEGVTVAADTGPVLRVLKQTAAVQHAAHHRLELRVLVAVGHLADVGAGRHLLLAVNVVQHTRVHTAHCLHTLIVGHAPGTKTWGLCLTDTIFYSGGKSECAEM